MREILLQGSFTEAFDGALGTENLHRDLLGRSFTEQIIYKRFILTITDFKWVRYADGATKQVKKNSNSHVYIYIYKYNINIINSILVDMCV